MNIEDFKKVIRNKRKKHMPTPRELVEVALEESEHYNKEQDYYLHNIDKVLFDLREICWTTYQNYEAKLNAKITETLFQDDVDDDEALSRKDIIVDFLTNYNNHLFELAKSNTNSRRARAGKEFEIIVEKILLHIGISFDDQGRIGKGIFERAGLGKLVDCVVPGVTEYNIEKRRCALISMKTSLRERWQEVPEEMKRTGASEMFLLTLDGGISDNTVDSLNSHNITLVVPNVLKETKYQKHFSVYGLTYFLEELLKIENQWLSRTDLPKSYYEEKLQTIELYLQDVDSTYERNFYESLKENILAKL